MDEVENACVRHQRSLQQHDLNWLLHRAAHQLGEAMEAEAAAHGITVRGQIVLTALVQGGHVGKPLSQLGLGQALGVDKTTMTSMLDRLERKGLLVRDADPADRRARIPRITEEGREVQAKLADRLIRVEDEVLADLGERERDGLRALLRRVIGPDAPPGSCL